MRLYAWSFLSPIPNHAELEKDASTIFSEKNPAGIELNTENQIKLLEELKTDQGTFKFTITYLSVNMHDDYWFAIAESDSPHVQAISALFRIQ